jgi:hypothetical protein
MVARSPTAIEAKLQRDREYMRDRNKRLRSNGLRVKCEGPARTGLAHCQQCAEKEAQRLIKHRRMLKEKAVAYLGGRCIDCGLQSEYAEVYDFHHRYPEEKDASIAYLMDTTKRWERIREELDKCDLLCSNCHRIRHAKEDRLLPP